MVRQLFLVQCTVGSNPTIPASTHNIFLTVRVFAFLPVYSLAFQVVRHPQTRNLPQISRILPKVWKRHLHGRRLGVLDAAGIVRRWSNQAPYFLTACGTFLSAHPKARDSVSQQPFGRQASWLRTGKHITQKVRCQEGQIDQLINPVF